MIPAPPAQTSVHNFPNVAPIFSACAVFVNQHGERFDDEFLGDEVTVQAVVHQPEALCFLIFDERVRTEGHTTDLPSDAFIRVENIREAGGEILESEDLEGLARLMSDRWSLSAHRLMGTLTEYNKAAAAGDASRLSVPRSGGLQALSAPPFYAIRFLPGVTFTYGGARTNERAQVLDSTDRFTVFLRLERMLADCIPVGIPVGWQSVLPMAVLRDVKLRSSHRPKLFRFRAYEF
jgi:hypothetical protein